MPMSAYKRALRAQAGRTLLMAPGTAAFIHDDAGRLLLQKRGDDGLWGLPGGELLPDELPADGLVRELWEEMGVVVEPLRLVGVFGGPDWHITHDNGDEDSVLDVVFACRLDGPIRCDGDEVLDVAYFTPVEVADLCADSTLISRSDRRLLEFAFHAGPETVFPPVTWQVPASGVRGGGIPAHEARVRALVGHTRLLTPAVGAFVRDEAGRVLLQQRADNGEWTPPAGAMDPFESPADACVREVWEETGLIVEPVRVVGVYGGPAYHITYLSSGDHAAPVSVQFECRPVSGTLTPDGRESVDVAFLPPEEVQARGLFSPRWQTRWAHYAALAGRAGAYFDPPVWTPSAQSPTQE